MSIVQNPSVREVLKLIVHDPDYQEVASVPLVPWQQVAMILLAYGGTAFGIVGYLSWGFPLWVSYPIMVYCMFVGFTPLHDGTHQALSSNKFINDFLGTLSGQTLFPGLNMPTYRALHMEHHRYVGDEQFDPDERFVRWPKFLGPVFLLFADLHWVYWYFTTAWSRWPKSLRKWVIGSLVSLVSIYTIGLLSPYWYEFVILYVIPQRLAVAYVAYMFAHIQHPEGLSWNKEPFQSTVQIEGNVIKRMSLLGQADHAMHHLLPHVPWYKYHRVWKLANGVLHDQNIPKRGLFFGPKEIIFESDSTGAPKRQQAIVTQVQDVARNVKSFTLEPEEGEFVEFDAGSHIDVFLSDGLVRQYSLLNAPSEENSYQIAVKLEPNGRGGSKAVHEQLLSGSTVQISEPRNNFTLYENARRYILIAGGIGLTPLLSMAHRLQELDLPFVLHICARTMDDVPFANELRCSSLAPHIDIHLSQDIGGGSLAFDSMVAKPRESDLVYLCGPQGFMDAVKGAALRTGWDSNRIHSEHFSAAAADDSENTSFDVVLARSGQTLKVGKDQSVLDALRNADTPVSYACLQGTCGSCVIPVLQGDIEHRDAYLSTNERQKGDQICVCVSRCKSKKLVIDL